MVMTPDEYSSHSLFVTSSLSCRVNLFILVAAVMSGVTDDIWCDDVIGLEVLGIRSGLGHP